MDAVFDLTRIDILVISTVAIVVPVAVLALWMAGREKYPV